MLEITLACFIGGMIAGGYLQSVLTKKLNDWFDNLGEPIHPRELPPHVRAEVQDLDQWTGYRRQSLRS